MTKNKTPLVSVIMPAFNSEKYIGEAIDSILAQTYKHFELIIINDGSVDKTAEIVTSYNDKRIKYFDNGTNLGIPKSSNKAIIYSKGKYIAILDQDDIAAKDRFEIQVKYLENKPEVAVCGSFYEVFNENSSIITRQPLMPKQIKTRLFFENPMGNPTVMMRNQIFKKDHLYYDESLKISSDFDLWCKVSHKYDIANLPFILTKYRDHSSQYSDNTLLMHKGDRVVLNRQAENLLKRKLAKEEQLIHFQLMNRLKGLDRPRVKYKNIMNWVDLLLEANLSNNVYDHETFKKEMKRWLERANLFIKGLIH
jgi:glycosyltransferase involved in cell wall biosynthesis